MRATRSCGGHRIPEWCIADSLVVGLAEIATLEPETWRRILARHNEPLLDAALCDRRLFKLLGSELRVPTSEGDLRLSTVRERSGDRIHIATGEEGATDDVLFHALGIPIVHGSRYAVRHFANQYGEEKGIPVVQLGTQEGDHALFQEEPLDERTEVKLRALLTSDAHALVACRFAPADLPLVLVPNRAAAQQRRIDGDRADEQMSTVTLGLARTATQKLDCKDATLYVNLDCPLVERLLQLEGAPERALAELLRSLGAMLTSRHRKTEAASDSTLASALEAFSRSVSTLIDAEAT